MIVYWRLLGESFGFALNALRTNKLRTLLSLLGVTVGIFSIIAVLTAVDSLDRKIKKDLSTLDKNTMYLTSVPFGPSEIPQWKIEQFPKVTYEEYQYLEKENIEGVEHMCFQFFTKSEQVRFESKSMSDVNMVAVTDEFDDIQRMEFEQGRFFNESESNSARSLVVLGYEIAQGLFDGADPIGKTVRIYGQRFQVIGVTKKKGDSMNMGGNDDTSAFIPSNFLRRLYGDKNDMMLPVVVIKPEKGFDIDELKANIGHQLRDYRGIKTDSIDNFFINILAGLTAFIDNMVGQLNAIGWIISGFSLLVGGFGIANIMFVSVKERTNLIGIQKSLGAKNKFILLQFLFESVILSVIGGIVGLLLVFIIAQVLTHVLDFEFVLSLGNALLGTGLSALIGLISGVLPAISASRLDPVEAIRTGM